MTDEQRATLVRLADFLAADHVDDGPLPLGLAAINAALAEVDRLKSAVDWWRDHAGELDRNWDAVHEAAMRPIRKALGLPEGTVPELLAEVDRLTAENAAAREVIDALIAAGRGEGLSYHKCSAAHNRAADFDRKFGKAARLAAADGESS